MADLRQRILDRVAQLETVARAAGGEMARWYLDDGCVVAAGGDGFEYGRPHPDLIEQHETPTSAERAHIAMWSPASVLVLATGAREICQVHRPEDDQHAYNFSRLPAVEARWCDGCRFTAEGRETYTITTCPSLRAVARMLGVDPDGDVDD